MTTPRDNNQVTVAVTGLNATDNPAPGISLIRSLRLNPDFNGRVVGLAYDTLEPGLYAKELVDDVYLIPYPSEGVEALKTRLSYIHEQVGLDVIIPTLDSELSQFQALEEFLNSLGIGMFLPTPEQFKLRAKVKLAEMGETTGISVPKTRVINDVKELYSIHEHMEFPVVVKGILYGAHIAATIDEAVAAFYKVAAKWGTPIIVQSFIAGDELNVVAVGDGEGGLIGAVPMRKMTVTDQGKGWAGIAIKDPSLLELTDRFISASKWRGPCELEVMRDGDGRIWLIEINPRFPAWVYLSAAAGSNLPYAVLELARGRKVEPQSEFKAGTMFVRISIDQIASLEDFQRVSTGGELHRNSNKQNGNNND